MSFIPILYGDFLNDLFFRRSWYNQNLALALPELTNAVHDSSVPLRSGYIRPWRNHSAKNSGMSKVINEKDKFEVNLDVQQFKPNEIDVKVVDNYIVIKGNHEERNDEHGSVSRKFTRRYHLPKDVDQQLITSTLSSDGVLQIHAPKKVLPKNEEKTVPIVQSDQSAVVKEQKPIKSKTQEKQVQENIKATEYNKTRKQTPKK